LEIRSIVNVRAVSGPKARSRALRRSSLPKASAIGQTARQGEKAVSRQARRAVRVGASPFSVGGDMAERLVLGIGAR
jgi:hypothetical protein